MWYVQCGINGEKWKLLFLTLVSYVPVHQAKSRVLGWRSWASYLILHANEAIVIKLFVDKQSICIQTKRVFKYLVTENGIFICLLKKAMPFLFLFRSVIYCHITMGPDLCLYVFLLQGEWTTIVVTGLRTILPFMDLLPLGAAMHIMTDMIGRNYEGGSFQLLTERKLSDPSYWGRITGWNARLWLSGYLLYSI